MSLKKLAIINPQKFNFDTRLISDFASLLKKETGTSSVVSLSQMDIADIIENNSIKTDVFIPVGGDGTLYEVVNNIDLKKHIVAIIPKGTGNGFAYDLGIDGVEHALNAIKNRRIINVDLIDVEYSVNKCLFRKKIVSTAGFGYIESVVNMANHFFKPLKKMCYPMASVVMAFKDTRIELNKDGEPSILSTIVINNTKHAGNIKIFPDASLNDGLMDIVAANNSTPEQLLYNAAVFSGNFNYKKEMREQMHSIHLEFRMPVAMMLDGEIIREVSMAKFQISSRKLRCFK